MAEEKKKRRAPKKKVLTPLGEWKRKAGKLLERVADLETRLTGMVPHLVDGERDRAKLIWEGALAAHQNSEPGEMGPWSVIALAMRAIKKRAEEDARMEAEADARMKAEEDALGWTLEDGGHGTVVLTPPKDAVTPTILVQQHSESDDRPMLQHSGGEFDVECRMVSNEGSSDLTVEHDNAPGEAANRFVVKPRGVEHEKETKDLAFIEKVAPSIGEAPQRKLCHIKGSDVAKSMPVIDICLVQTRDGEYRARAKGGGLEVRTPNFSDRMSALVEACEVLGMLDGATKKKAIARVLMQHSIGAQGQLAITSIWVESAHAPVPRADHTEGPVSELFRMTGSYFEEAYVECATSLAIQLADQPLSHVKQTLRLCCLSFREMVYDQMRKMGTHAFELKDL